MSKHNYDIDHYCGQDAAGALTFPIFRESYYDSARRVRADRARVSIGGVEFVFGSETPDRLIRIDREVPSYMLYPDPVRKLRDAFERGNYLKNQMDGLRDKNAELQAQLDDALENERAAESEADLLRAENEKLRERLKEAEDQARYTQLALEAYRGHDIDGNKWLKILEQQQVEEHVAVFGTPKRRLVTTKAVFESVSPDRAVWDATGDPEPPCRIPAHRPIQCTQLIRKPYLKRRPWWKFIFCRKDK